MNYGNSKITGTVGIQGFGFSDAEYFNASNAATQFGIGQAYFTVHPDLGLSNVRLTWKMGACTAPTVTQRPAKLVESTPFAT